MRPPSLLAVALTAAAGCAPDVVTMSADAGAGTDAPSDVRPLADASSDSEPDVVAADVAAPPPDAPGDAAADVAAPDAPADVPAAARDFSVAGPYRVAIWTGPVAGVTGTARVLYPMGGERHPLVVFAHGFQLQTGSYDRLLAHVASWGYVAASVDYPGTLLMVDHRNVPAALVAARRAFAGLGVAGFPAASRVDASRAVAMGHSLGAKGAVMALLDDAGFVAGLALDPVDDNPAPFGRVTDATPSVAPERMGALRRPLGLVGATQSRCARFGQTCAPEASDYRRFAAAAPAGVPVATWALRDFGHMDFVDPGCGLACSACSAGAAPLDARLAALRGLAVAFLERHARGDASAQGYVDGAERAALVASGALWDGAASTLPPCR